MRILLLWAACSSPVDADAARGWALRHGGTLVSNRTRLSRLLASLPSLPGDRFFCRETVAPPGFEGDPTALREALCRQQLLAWQSERHRAEEELGTEWLNGAFLHLGVVGVGLTLSGPEGVEWSDHRGIWQLSDPGGTPAEPGGIALSIPGATPEQAIEGRLGWGLVELDASGGPLPAFEWIDPIRRREATAALRLVILAEGSPGTDFLRQALDRPSPRD